MVAGFQPLVFSGAEDPGRWPRLAWCRALGPVFGAGVFPRPMAQAGMG
jgi:hypothetical protein